MSLRPALLAPALALAVGCGPAPEAPEADDEPVAAAAQELLGPNVLQNACFGTIGLAGNPVSVITSVPGPAGQSAAASWTMYSTNPCYLSTEVVPSTRRRGGRMLHIVTRGTRNGVVQRLLSPLPGHAQASAWFYVRVGRAAIGSGNGINNLDAVTTKLNQWEQLSAPSGTSPVNVASIFSASTEGADFYVDCASVAQVLP